MGHPRRAVTAVFFVNGIIIGSWAPYVPLVKSGLDLGDAALGTALLAMGAGALAAMIFASILIDRYGSAAVVRVSCLLLCPWIALPVFAPGFALLFAALAAFGALIGTMDVAMNAQAVAVERTCSRPIMSSFHGMWSLGGLAGSALGGLALQTIPVWVHLALVSAAALAIAAWGLRGLVTGDRGGIPKKMALSLPGRATWALGLLAFLAMTSEGIVLDWSAVYLTQSLNADTALAAAGFAAFSGTMASARFLGDTIRARTSAVTLARLSAAVTAAGFGLSVLAPTPFVAIVGFAIAGFGMANIVPLFFSAAGRVEGKSPSANLAAVATSGYSGFLIGPVLIGFLSSETSLGTALLVLPVAALIILAGATVVHPADRP